MSANASQNYQTQQIMTASPAMLVFMLFDKAIACLNEAVRAIDRGDIEARWKANKRAMEILEHLRMTLDIDAGGEIAENLDRLYGLALRELPKVDLRNDPAPAREVIRLLEPLRDSWREIANQGDDAARRAAQAAAAGRPAGRSAGGTAASRTAQADRPETGGRDSASKTGKTEPGTTPPGGITLSA